MRTDMTDLIERFSGGAIRPPLEPGEHGPAVGFIGIEWPAGEGAGDRAIPAWRVAFYDDGGYVTTIKTMTLHADVHAFIWADLTMFADADGKPVLHLPKGQDPHCGEDGDVAYGTFRFLIGGMRVGSPE